MKKDIHFLNIDHNFSQMFTLFHNNQKEYCEIFIVLNIVFSFKQNSFKLQCARFSFLKKHKQQKLYFKWINVLTFCENCDIYIISLKICQKLTFLSQIQPITVSYKLLDKKIKTYEETHIKGFYNLHKKYIKILQYKIQDTNTYRIFPIKRPRGRYILQRGGGRLIETNYWQNLVFNNCVILNK